MQLVATVLETGKRPMTVYAVGMVGVVGVAAAAVLAPGFFRSYGTLVLGGAGALYAVALTASMRPRTRQIMLSLGLHGLDDGAGTRIARADVAQAFVREAHEGGMVSNVRVPASPPALEVITAGQHLRFGVASVQEGTAALDAMGLPRVVVPPSYVATVVTPAARTQARGAWMASLVVMVLVLGLGVGSAVFMSRRAASTGASVGTGVEQRAPAPLLSRHAPAPVAAPTTTAEVEPPPRAPAATPPAGTRPRLTLGPARKVRGGLSAEVVTRVVRSRYSALAACVSATSAARGVTTATLAIAIDGSVSSAAIAADDAALGACVARALRSISFPTARTATTATVPLTLS